MARRPPGSGRPWRQARDNVTLLAMAVGLALVIWFLITDTENEAVEERLGFGLAVEAVNIPNGLATANRIPTALITIAGHQDDVDTASADDFEASVDLGRLPAGTHQVPVRVRSLTDSVRVREVSPQSVEVTLEPVVERIVPVSVVLLNPPPLGFEVGDASLSVDTVVVRGIQQLIDLVDVVVAPVDVGRATVDVSLPVTLQARTTTGASVSGIRVEPPSIEVSVPIQQEIFRRAVAITPQLVGLPAPGYHIAAVNVEPLTVIVVGTLEALESASDAGTSAISIANVSSDIEAVVSAIPPEGLALEAEVGVTVRVTLAPIIGEATFDVQVELRDLGEDLVATTIQQTVRVTIRGPAADLAGLAEGPLRVSVSVIELGPGVHTVPVRLGFVSGIEVVGVQPQEVDVLIGSAPPPPEEEEAAEAEEGEEAP